MSELSRIVAVISAVLISVVACSGTSDAGQAAPATSASPPSLASLMPYGCRAEVTQHYLAGDLDSTVNLEVSGALICGAEPQRSTLFGVLEVKSPTGWERVHTFDPHTLDARLNQRSGDPRGSVSLMENHHTVGVKCTSNAPQVWQARVWGLVTADGAHYSVPEKTSGEFVADCSVR